MRRLLLLALVSHSAVAAELNWPGSGICSTTLQACINAAATGDTVQITTEGVINESLIISNKSLTLTKRGAAALFADGRSIDLTATGANINISLSNLRLRGQVFVRVGSGVVAQTQSIGLDNMRLEPGGTSFSAVQISEAAGAASTYTVTVERSYLTQGNPSGAALFFDGGVGAARPAINVRNNQMLVRGSGVAALISAHDGAVNINGNRIGRLQQLPIGGTLSAGVFVSGTGGGTLPATVRVTRNAIFNVDTGVVIRATAAPLIASVLNNTLSGANLSGVALQRDASNTVAGRIANNIVHRATNCGIEFLSAAGISTTHNFNLYSQSPTPYCNTVAGANDVNAIARFRGPFDFQARDSGAPQVNAGNNSDQPVIVIIVPVPLPDIDGRAGRVGGTVDIGAHERSFDQSFEHYSLAANVNSNVTRIATPPVGLLPNDNLTLSHFGREIDGVTPLPAGAANHTGVWFSGGINLWNIFNQNTSAPMPTGRRYFVLLNIDTQTSYVHTAVAANTGFNLTTLDNTQLNNQPNALPIVTQRWDPAQAGSGVYNNSSIGVWFDTSVNRWRVFNQAPVAGLPPAMPEGAAFNVLIPNPLFAAGTHAFRTEPLGVAVQILNISHPLLDNIECAHPFVTAVYNPNNVYVPSNLLLSYNSATQGRGQWAIERGDGAAIPAGAAFHVYIDPERSRVCTSEPLLIDGFE